MGQALAIGLFFNLLGAGIFWWSFRKWSTGRSQAAAAQYWPEAAAVVEAANIKSTSEACYPWIRYRFQIGGQTFNGDRLAFGMVVTRFMSKARASLAPYPPGSSIRVRYNPHDPRDNVVEPRFAGAGSAFAMMIVGVITFFLGIVFYLVGAMQ
jgi:hypothetical protein